MIIFGAKTNYMANYKYRNYDEYGERYAQSVLESREKETFTREELKNELQSACCFALQFAETMDVGEYGTFGQAIEALRRGFKVAREGWNGKGMFLWLKPGTIIKAEWCKDEKLKAIVDANGGEMEGLGTICMKTADNKILTGWLASQTDMLSADWVIVD